MLPYGTPLTHLRLASITSTDMRCPLRHTAAPIECCLFDLLSRADRGPASLPRSVSVRPTSVKPPVTCSVGGGLGIDYIVDTLSAPDIVDAPCGGVPMDLARYVVDAVVVEKRSVREVARSDGVSKSWVSVLVTRYRLPARRGAGHAISAAPAQSMADPSAHRRGHRDAQEAPLRPRPRQRTSNHCLASRAPGPGGAGRIHHRVDLVPASPPMAMAKWRVPRGSRMDPRTSKLGRDLRRCARRCPGVAQSGEPPHRISPDSYKVRAARRGGVAGLRLEGNPPCGKNCGKGVCSADDSHMFVRGSSNLQERHLHLHDPARSRPVTVQIELPELASPRLTACLSPTSKGVPSSLEVRTVEGEIAGDHSHCARSGPGWW